MAAPFWLFLAPLLTGAFVGLLVAFLLEEDNPWRWAGLLVGAVAALLLRLANAGARARCCRATRPLAASVAADTNEFRPATRRGRPRPDSQNGLGRGGVVHQPGTCTRRRVHKLKGRVGEFTFLAGTELRVVEATIRKARAPPGRRPRCSGSPSDRGSRGAAGNSNAAGNRALRGRACAGG